MAKTSKKYNTVKKKSINRNVKKFFTKVEVTLAYKQSFYSFFIKFVEKFDWE